MTPETLALQDAVLTSIVGGRLDHAALRALPRWRAVLLARVACRAGVLTRAERDKLVREVAVLGELRPARR